MALKCGRKGSRREGCRKSFRRAESAVVLAKKKLLMQYTVTRSLTHLFGGWKSVLGMLGTAYALKRFNVNNNEPT